MEIEASKLSASEEPMEMMMLMDNLPHFFPSPPPASYEFLSTSNTNRNTNSDIDVNSHGYLQSQPGNVNHQLEQQLSDLIASGSFTPEYSPPLDTDVNSMPTQQRNSSITAMREMIFWVAVMQPIHIDPESIKPPKRRNVKISKDPQSVAARHRRERISERIRILQRLVPGGTKMDTASMLDEAIHYVKFLKTQVQSLERAQGNSNNVASRAVTTTGIGFPAPMSTSSYFGIMEHRSPASASHNAQHYRDAN